MIYLPLIENLNNSPQVKNTKWLSRLSCTSLLWISPVFKIDSWCLAVTWGHNCAFLKSWPHFNKHGMVVRLHELSCSRIFSDVVTNAHPASLFLQVYRTLVVSFSRVKFLVLPKAHRQFGHVCTLVKHSLHKLWPKKRDMELSVNKNS